MGKFIERCGFVMQCCHWTYCNCFSSRFSVMAPGSRFNCHVFHDKTIWQCRMAFRRTTKAYNHLDEFSPVWPLRWTVNSLVYSDVPHLPNSNRPTASAFVCAYLWTRDKMAHLDCQLVPKFYTAYLLLEVISCQLFLNLVRSAAIFISFLVDNTQRENIVLFQVDNTGSINWTI